MRKLTCPFCGWVHVFSPKNKSKFKKRVVGFTCPNCNKKITDKEIIRKRGSGPKPPGERRNRVKKMEVVKETSPVVVQPYVEQFEWKTREPSPPGEPRRYGGRAGWRPKIPRHKPPQPTDRTLEEVIVEAFLSKPTKSETRVEDAKE